MSNSSRSWASSARPKKISVRTTASIEATPRGERQTVRQRSSVNVRRCMGSEYLAFDLRKYLRRQSEARTLEHPPVLPRGTRQSRKRLLALPRIQRQRYGNQLLRDGLGPSAGDGHWRGFTRRS